jgi:signal transduction histidine kinase
MTLHPCRDNRVTESSFCIPFLFSNSHVASARLYFSPDAMPSPEHTHLLQEVATEVASAFHRVQLQRLIKTRDESINTEQQRIARDVHDTLGHSLAYLRLRLDQISLELNHNGTHTLQQEVTILRDVAKEAYEQMRDMLITLSPNTNLNLNDTLEKYAARISTRANFELNIRHSGKPRTLAPLVQRNVINIFREILTNIENHAHARQVALDLNWETQYFEVKVQDNGVGFDPALPVEFGHFGLSNMRERSKESHIEFFLVSQVGDGTQLTLRVPLEGEL